MVDSSIDRTTRLADVLLGSTVVALTGFTGVGAAVGGWLAGRRASGPVLGSARSAVAGLAGALPWAALVYLASAGAIDPVGYHRNGVHIGINTAAPGLLAPWQEIGLAALVAGTIVAAAVCGGVVAGLGTDVVGKLRRERSNAN
jgi:hypothetical protein